MLASIGGGAHRLSTRDEVAALAPGDITSAMHRLIDSALSLPNESDRDCCRLFFPHTTGVTPFLLSSERALRLRTVRSRAQIAGQFLSHERPRVIEADLVQRVSRWYVTCSLIADGRPPRLAQFTMHLDRANEGFGTTKRGSYMTVVIAP